jgi:hypothetical protein
MFQTILLKSSQNFSSLQIISKPASIVRRVNNETKLKKQQPDQAWMIYAKTKPYQKSI